MKDNKREIGEVILVNKETGEKINLHPIDAEVVNKANKVEVYEPDIIFLGKDNLEILRLKNNGDIYVKNKLIENDSEVVNGLREFLFSHGIR